MVADARTGYKNAILWIQQQIDSNSWYRTDDTRFWVSIPPVRAPLIGYCGEADAV
jgi:hypothetical protein